MVGILLALSLQANQTAITEALNSVHIIVTDEHTELLEQVTQLKPDVFLIDTYHASNQELLATYRTLVPWGYIVLIYQQASDLQFSRQVDEVWPVATLAMGQVTLLLRLARLNHYRNERTSKCKLASSEGPYDDACFKGLERFLVAGERFASPGAWGRQFFEQWTFLLQHVTAAFGVGAIAAWPCAPPVEPDRALKSVVNVDTLLPDKLRSAVTDSGVKFESIFGGTALLLSMRFEGAFFPLLVLWCTENTGEYAQKIAEAASSYYTGAYAIRNTGAVLQLVNNIIRHVVNTINHQYAVALYSFGQCVFCREIIADKAYYDAISWALDLGIILLDTDCNVIFANELAVRLLTSRGLTTDEATTAGLPLLDEILERIAAARQSVRVRFTLCAPNGNRLAISAVQAFSSESELLGYVVTVQDETEAQEAKLEARLRERLASVGELAAGMAHEIRNPLTSIRGFMQLLKQRLITAEMEAEIRYADYVLEEIDRANHVITNFLTLAKPQDEVWLQVDINELLTKMLQLVENQAVLRGVRLTWQFAPNLALIRGKAEALVQVFLNIVTNALQATSKGGSIHILTRQIGDHVLVSVQDSGVGMSPAVQKRIFNPFYSTKEGGTGLGLALCRQIIHEHQGEIEVTSTIGVGSCFTVCLPITNNM